MAADKKQEAKTSGVSNIAASGASKAAGKAATRIATQGAIRAGFTAASSTIGNVAGFAASQAVIWANKHKKEAAALLAAPLTLPLAAIGAFFGLLTAGIVGVAAAVGLSLVIAVIAIPVLIAFFMFIINSGAYIIPPAGVFIGDISNIPLTEGCPTGWPVKTSEVITQGADTVGSHQDYEGIDMSANMNTPVFATHGGVVVAIDDSLGRLGRKVRVQSICSGTVFFSSYAHLNIIGVTTGAVIPKGAQVGLSGNSGRFPNGGVYAAHLDYAFCLGEASGGCTRAGPPPVNPPFMTVPFIPTTVPRGCIGATACNVAVN